MKKMIFALMLLGLNLFASDKLIIAHRGASAYLPESTQEAMVLAHAMGAHYVEFDLVLSKDNIPVIIHDLYLDNLSDVAQKFPQRKREDGHYYVIDFTLDELKTLKMSEVFTLKDGKQEQKYPKRCPMGDASFAISTLSEMIELIQGLNQVFGKNIGFCIEIKKPWFHKQEGKDISKVVLEIFKNYGLDTNNLYFSSFDYPELVRIKKELLPQMDMDVNLVFALGKNEWNETYALENGKWVAFDYTPFQSGKRNAELAKIVMGIAPNYNELFTIKENKAQPNAFVKNAHKHKLKVFVWTHRADALPSWTQSSDALLDAILFKAGADGVFTDFPDLGLQFLKKVQ
ncbi:glycerophosphodiester phosphodiesterase [Helicobacter sp.]|uniref:glycerophosphodiester phosphodiesterase n=1 Tax=Helicobacter sp. TaxID=218 RepID=UPI0025C587A9|nr:glycerophosphodiester phosphodiesterase [Helicobacter sp.]MCI5968274.1 glycerophosphodiester phosphodiesterase [Helicobacter sp.]MDY2585366.1 glycerophosphodiester phosphodiesterase [Helicobacter sp.]